MEELLRAEGDVDALIALNTADLLPSGYTHLLIAHELYQAGRAGEALEWAERGLREAAACKTMPPPPARLAAPAPAGVMARSGSVR